MTNTTADQERAAIVAWLRGEDSVCDCFARDEGECACGAWYDHKRALPSSMADAIERGDHKSEKMPIKTGRGEHG